MKTKLNTNVAWSMLTLKKVKVLASTKADFKLAKKILSVVDDDVIDSIEQSCVLHYTDELIVFEKGYTIEKEDITTAHMMDDWLFVSMSNWIMVFKVYE